MALKLVLDPGTEFLLPFAKKKLAQIKATKASAFQSVSKIIEASSGERIEISSLHAFDMIRITGGIAYITLGTEVLPSNYIAKAQANFKRTFRRFKSVFADTDASNAPGLTAITGFESIALRLFQQKVHVYLVKKGGSSKQVFEIQYGDQPPSEIVGETVPGVAGAFCLVDKNRWLLISLDYYYEASGESFHRPVISRTNDAGKTWATFEIEPFDIAGETDQYISGLDFLGNNTVTFLSGFTPHAGGIFPDEPVLFRSEDGTLSWSVYSLPELFAAWVPPGASRESKIRAYETFVKSAIIRPIGNNTVLLIAERIPFDAYVYKSVDGGITFDEGTLFGDSYFDLSPLGVGAAMAGRQTGSVFSVALTNDFAASWIYRAAPLPQATFYTLVETPTKTEDGKVDLDKLRLIAPFYDTDGYYVYHTKDGGQTWTKGGLIAKTAVNLELNFAPVTALSVPGSFAFSNLYANNGPLEG